MKYLKKTDWGDYWQTEAGISRAELIERALTQVAHLGICLPPSPGPDPEEAPIISESLTIIWPLAGHSKNPAVSRGPKLGGR